MPYSVVHRPAQCFDRAIHVDLAKLPGIDAVHHRGGVNHDRARSPGHWEWVGRRRRGRNVQCATLARGTLRAMPEDGAAPDEMAGQETAHEASGAGDDVGVVHESSRIHCVCR